MFEFDWQSKKHAEAERPLAGPARPQLSRGDVARTMLVHWQEHCLECAPPHCYSSCSLFVARADRKCARLAYGFARSKLFPGLLNHGADVRFRRWGKIETALRPRAVGVGAHRFVSALDRVATGAVNLISSALRPVSPFRRLNGALTLFREKFLTRIAASATPPDFDAFVMECYLADEKPSRVLLELWNGGTLAFREAVSLVPGANFVTLPAGRVLRQVDWRHARLTLYPENDAELRLVFSWLDFVKFRDAARQIPKAAPAEKVKCVAWDLDNTLWNGTLVEDGADRLSLRPGVAELIRALDERGMLQTIVSKNDFEQAWLAVKRFGLAEYFLHPAINWGAKSENLRQTAARLNIGIDTFALIDDSPFERAEVQAALPVVRVYAETETAGLLARPEFDVPVTEMSRVRRASYAAEAKRTEAQQMFPGEYKEFLRSCGMRLRIFAPREPAEILRCHELIQRSNQLNLSARRFSMPEFATLLGTSGILNLALECQDAFGSYGVVGFVSVDERGADPVVTDFVLSCRVAQKRVEHAFFQWLNRHERGRGCRALLANLSMTDRNGPLVAVFEDLKFQREPTGDSSVKLRLSLENLPDDETIVTVTTGTTQ